MKFRLKRIYANFLKYKEAFQRYTFKHFNVVEIGVFWLKSQLSRAQFLVISGILVGITGGLAGVLLKWSVGRIHLFIESDLQFEERLWVYALLPIIGITATALVVHVFFKGDDGKGIPLILNDIATKNSNVQSSKMYSQMLQSALTIGFGGSAGLESPMAVTGAAIGSNYAQRYRLDYKERTLLLAAGASAGIASAFNAPIAGVMFAFELLLVGLVFTDFIPLVIAAICGSLLSKIILDEDVLFTFFARDSFNYVNTLYYVVLGVLTGLYGRYFLLVGHRVHNQFRRFKDRFLLKAITGGALLSVLCIVFPPLFGEGYSSIRVLQEGRIDLIIHESLFRYIDAPQLVIVVFLGLIVLFKAFATAITLHSGGNGGNFAPTLIAGGFLGYWFGYTAGLMGFEDVPVTNLMIVGMAGVMAGALYAPLTAIFLIAESSSGYDLFIPLMIVSVISYLLNRSFSPINPDLQKMVDEGKVFTDKQDRNLLLQIELKDCMSKFSPRVNLHSDGMAVVNRFRNTSRNTIAVVDDDQTFCGIITREDLLPYLSGEEPAENLSLENVAIRPAAIIAPGENAIEVMRKLDEANVWQLPVVGEKGEFIGFVNKSEILTRYRTLLVEFSTS